MKWSLEKQTTTNDDDNWATAKPNQMSLQWLAIASNPKTHSVQHAIENTGLPPGHIREANPEVVTKRRHGGAPEKLEALLSNKPLMSPWTLNG